MEAAEEKLTQNRYAEASELFRKVVAVNPESRPAIKALYKLGFTLETYLKDYDGAVFNYQEFIRQSTDRVSIYEVQKRIAGIYFEQSRDNDKAIAAYRKLITLSPQSLEIDFFQFRIAESFFRQNNFEQARLEYQTLLEKFPRSQFCVKARFGIGNSDYMEGKYDLAIDAMKQVIRHHPQSDSATEAEFLMGQSMEQSNKLQNAMQVYENLKGRYSSPEVLNIRIAELKKRMKKEK